MSMLQREKVLYGIKVTLRYLLRVFWIFPIKYNRVFFTTRYCLQYSECPKAISIYLQKNFPGEFDAVFALKHPKKWDGEGERFVKFPSVRYFYDMCTAKIIVDSNGGIPDYIPKRKGQYVIDTEHGGGAYKSNKTHAVTESKEPTKQSHAKALYKSRNLDLMLSSCAIFSKMVVPDLAPEYKGEIMNCGMPRNDIFFQKDYILRRSKVCETLGLDPNKKIVLYAPTWRGSITQIKEKKKGKTLNFDIDLDVERLLAAVSKRFDAETVFMIRAHLVQLVVGMSRKFQWGTSLDVSDYPDMQELLIAADVLISDYSSTIWDYSLMKKPCFLYVPDMDAYISERGVYTPIETWPGILCRTNDELEQAVLKFDEMAYRARIEQYHKDMGSYETGTACKQVCERIAQVCGVKV